MVLCGFGLVIMEFFGRLDGFDVLIRNQVD